MVGVLSDYCTGRRIVRVYEHRRSSGWNSKNPVWGISVLVSHLAIPWTASCLRPVNVRVVPDWHYSNHIKRPVHYRSGSEGVVFAV